MSRATSNVSSSRSGEDRERARPRPLRAAHNLGDGNISSSSGSFTTPFYPPTPSDQFRSRGSPRICSTRSSPGIQQEEYVSYAITRRRSGDFTGYADGPMGQMSGAPRDASTRSSPASSTGRITPSRSSGPMVFNPAQANYSYGAGLVNVPLSSSWEKSGMEQNYPLYSFGQAAASDHSRSPALNQSGRSSRSMSSTPSSATGRKSRGSSAEMYNADELRSCLDDIIDRHKQCMQDIEELYITLSSRHSTPSSPSTPFSNRRRASGERPHVPIPDGNYGKSESFRAINPTPITPSGTHKEFLSELVSREQPELGGAIHVPAGFASSNKNLSDTCIKTLPVRKMPSQEHTCHSPRDTNRSGSIEIYSPRSAFDTPRSRSDSSCSSAANNS